MPNVTLTIENREGCTWKWTMYPHGGPQQVFTQETNPNGRMDTGIPERTPASHVIELVDNVSGYTTVVIVKGELLNGYEGSITVSDKGKYEFIQFTGTTYQTIEENLVLTSTYSNPEVVATYVYKNGGLTRDGNLKFLDEIEYNDPHFDSFLDPAMNTKSSDGQKFWDEIHEISQWGDFVIPVYEGLTVSGSYFRDFEPAGYFGTPRNLEELEELVKKRIQLSAVVWAEEYENPYKS